MKIAGTSTRPPAPPEKLKALEAALPASFPPDFITFFERWDGADIWFDEVDWGRDPFDYLRIDPIDDILDPKTRATLAEVFPGLFVIGSDGGGQVLAYDTGQPLPWPIVMHLPGYSDANNRPVVASSMQELIQKYLAQ